MHRIICRLAIFSVLALLPTIASFAQTTQPIETDYEQLARFGDAVRQSDEYKDNIYIYREVCRQLLDATDSYAGATLKFVVRVERVSLSEVFIEFEDAGNTRIILRHLEPPFFGNNSTLRYNGPPSTIRRHFLAKPVGLRIGSEIDLEVARRLRTNNALIMSATIEKMQVRLAPPAFEPSAFTTLINWKVIQVRETVLEAKEYLRGYPVISQM